jgi:DNA repair protein RecO (recombination protein O)
MRGMLQSFQPLVGAWSGKLELKNLHALEWGSGLLVLQGEALMCGFYLNELLLRLLPREDAHETLFDYYGQALRTLTSGNDFATTLRRFELRMLQEMGYAVPLERDEHEDPIEAERDYCYIAERGACSPSSRQNGLQSCQISGKTLLDMVQDNYTDPRTQQQSKQLMRALLAHYLGDKPLHTRQLLIDLQGL